ncbi:hypothetical protein BHE74_00018359 [Ensete ventricosum]|nr:hypothetical protein BHE74_00018359 [Ensete ventricosum]
MMFNGFDAFGCTEVRSCTERRLRWFPGSRSTGPTTAGITSWVSGAIPGLTCPDYRVADVVVHVALAGTIPDVEPLARFQGDLDHGVRTEAPEVCPGQLYETLQGRCHQHPS